jgi:hypothetical protein
VENTLDVISNKYNANLIIIHLLKNSNFRIIAKNVKFDAEKQVLLPRSIVHDSITNHVYTKNLGQIILDPICINAWFIATAVFILFSCS